MNLVAALASLSRPALETAGTLQERAHVLEAIEALSAHLELHHEHKAAGQALAALQQAEQHQLILFELLANPGGRK